MLWDKIEADWRRFKHHAKRRWDRLGEKQLESIAGRRSLLVARISDAYGVTREEAERQLGEWQVELAHLVQG